MKFLRGVSVVWAGAVFLAALAVVITLLAAGRHEPNMVKPAPVGSPTVIVTIMPGHPPSVRVTRIPGQVVTPPFAPERSRTGPPSRPPAPVAPKPSPSRTPRPTRTPQPSPGPSVCVLIVCLGD